MNEKLTRMRVRAAALYDMQCFVCRKPFGPRFQFHHLSYPDGWKTHRDFKTNPKYNEYILPKIMKHPHVFRLLCHACHRLVSMTQKIRDEPRFERLIDTCVRSRFRRRSRAAGGSCRGGRRGPAKRKSGRPANT